jgi:hypothetical protein
MPNNSLYPGFIKLFYTSNTHGHLQVIPIQAPVDTGGGVWQVGKKGGANGLFSAEILTYVNVVKTLFPAASSFTFAELWTMASATADPVFQQTVNLAVAGTHGTGAQANAQLSVTFRSQAGGLYRGLFMESSYAVNVRDDAPLGDASQNAYAATYAIANGSIVSARDGGFLTAVIRSLTKTNDKLREKFLLDV